ncbi:MAG: DnaJ domain-containing protein [Treponema sp.]|nr:DnaJ domain-containing protein [Treponema sp.]
MKNFYKILGVRQNASFAEIKKAYREKVKQLHPDKVGDNSHVEEFNEVLKAYRVLSDSRQRSIFDESYFVRHKQDFSKADSFDYYKWLSERQDSESRAKLIFYTLMHQKEDEAVAEFKKMQMSSTGFTLKDYFTREDFMDYGYILAEELVIRGEYYDAIILLEQIIKMEYSYTYFYIFFPEVIAFTLNILKKNIDGVISDELALDVYERALDLNLGKANDAFFLRKMSEEYARLGDSYTAEVCLRESMKLG